MLKKKKTIEAVSIEFFFTEIREKGRLGTMIALRRKHSKELHGCYTSRGVMTLALFHPTSPEM